MSEQAYFHLWTVLLIMPHGFPFLTQTPLFYLFNEKKLPQSHRPEALYQKISRVLPFIRKKYFFPRICGNEVNRLQERLPKLQTFRIGSDLKAHVVQLFYLYGQVHSPRIATSGPLIAQGWALTMSNPSSKICQMWAERPPPSCSLFSEPAPVFLSLS